MNLGLYKTKHVLDRRDKLVMAAGERDLMMARMDLFYTMDTWGREQPVDGTQKISLPIAYDMVNKTKALLISRTPTISVICAGDMNDEQALQKHEKVLYGYAAQAQLWQHLSDAVWYGLTYGRGYLKRVYDDNAIAGEWPLPTYAVDPRKVYGVRDVTDRYYTELVHTWRRTRREIEDEGFKLKERPSDNDEQRLEAWLDEEVGWVEYWFTKVVEEESHEPEAMSHELGEMVGMGAEAEGMGYKEEAASPKKKKRVRGVFHTIIVEDAAGAKKSDDDERRGYVVKRCARMKGYKRIPFYNVDGLRVPTKPDGVSLLYPLTGGDGPEWVKGVIASANLMMSLFMDAAAQASHPTSKTNDPEVLKHWDNSAGAVNYVPSGAYFDYVIPPAGNPALMRTMDQLFRQIDRVGVPEVLNGQVFNLSGQAISGLSNAFQMVLAERQQQIERMLEDLLDDTLVLMQEWIDPEDGLMIDGADRLGNRYALQVIDEDIDPEYYRAQVKLSSGMPKDDNAELSNLARMVQAKYLPVTELLEAYTKMKGKGSEAPQVLFERAMKEHAMMGDKQIGEMFAEKARMEVMPPMMPTMPQAMPQPPEMPAMPTLPEMPQQAMPPQAMPQQAMPQQPEVNPNVISMLG